MLKKRKQETDEAVSSFYGFIYLSMWIFPGVECDLKDFTFTYNFSQ